MRRPTRAIRALFLGTLAMPLATGLALASSEAPRLGLTPVGDHGTYFDLTMEAGETRFLEVEVANFGGDEILARIYAADAYTIVNGGFGAELFGDESSGTTLWLDFPTEELTLGPRDGVAMSFEITVPDDTLPGEYVTGLVVENVDAFVGAGEGDIGFEQVNRSAIAVAVDVPGPRRPALEIGAVGHELVNGLSVVSFEAHNTGNVHLKPSGEFVLRSAAGDPLARATPAMGSLYAGTSTAVEAPLASPLRPGEYCAELRVADEQTGVDYATVCLPFSVRQPIDTDVDGSGSQAIPIVQPIIDAAGRTPGLLALVLAPVLVVAAAVLIVRRRRRGGWDGAPPSPQARSRPTWPAADALPMAGTDRPLVPAEVEVLLSLRDEFSRLPMVERAWLVERDEGTLVAIEGIAGTTPADGGRMVVALQRAADERMANRPVRVVYVQGDGPVARVTAMAEPFYRRQPHWVQFGT